LELLHVERGLCHGCHLLSSSGSIGIWLRSWPEGAVAASVGDPYFAPVAYLSSDAPRRDTAPMHALVGRAFVGRERELGRLEQARRETASGSGAAVLLAGDAGIGKTRLASELVARARETGFEVLVGRCLDLLGIELPYQPFTEALRPLRARRGEAEASPS